MITIAKSTIHAKYSKKKYLMLKNMIPSNKVCQLYFLSNVSTDEPGANPIKLALPMPKFWSWRNYEKSLFQSYKTHFST
jgi:hypothetical protein